VVPNMLLRNVGGARFEDVTLSSGTGHLQKGHGMNGIKTAITLSGITP